MRLFNGAIRLLISLLSFLFFRVHGITHGRFCRQQTPSSSSSSSSSSSPSPSSDSVSCCCCCWCCGGGISLRLSSLMFSWNPGARSSPELKYLTAPISPAPPVYLNNSRDGARAPPPARRPPAARSLLKTTHRPDSLI